MAWSPAEPLPALPANSACPRCGESFRCGVSDANCHCASQKLSPRLREQLCQSYQTCLCGSCLTALNLRDQAES
jgi:hypothetical protein